jgi:hypothetical protein
MLDIIFTKLKILRTVSVLNEFRKTKFRYKIYPFIAT